MVQEERENGRKYFGKKRESCGDKIMSKRLIKDRKGTSTVEFAIVLPVLLLILFGIVEMALVFYDKAMITNASREGARAGIVFRADANTGIYSPMTETQISTVVNNYLADNLVTFSNATATTGVDPDQCPPLTATPPRQITVTITYPYTFLVLPNFIASLLGVNPLNLTAVTVMRCE
jgi:Flp pilus assembly protein TadG